MRIGAHSQMFIHDIAEDVDGVFDAVASYGLDAIELHVGDATTFPTEAVAKAARRTGLEVVLGTALRAGQSTIAEEAHVRQQGLDHLRRCIAIAEAVGAGVIAGGVHSANGSFVGRGRTEAEWARSVHALQAVASDAEAADVVVTVEPVSRYSGYFLNTATDAIALVDAVDSSHVAVQLDTFHMNIEEADPVAAIEAAGSRLRHFHAVENNRGIPGTGQVPWRAIFEALERIGYDGLFVYEHFPRTLPQMAVRTHTWRTIATSEEVCVEGSRRLRAIAADAGYGVRTGRR
ncbi:sugar phosphate isomerase/epimerase [Aeromicrobium phragmitis]|uniref:Sugar phosphate isomerase/epimerase n=1 Tax=Aeromicrobium phragmitis TaxID=2478914 RepID=A0A3L8PIB2_9ACTN|nr:sugar phosphate isomerase/epimerase family protein [Aeromicrobium phragmitis]RLV55086.1 sugar phosphate isomerase/epimerase [Aeromicrobium phragmitis]